MLAVITGATSGLGYEFAKQLSKEGYDLILSGRNESKLLEMKNLFTNTDIIALDLSKPDSAKELYAFCKNKDVDLLINNAGYGLFGEFTETDLDEELDLLKVNILALHTLTKLFLKDFKAKDKGTILNVASSAAFLTGPLLSSYYASKHYVLQLSLALYEELRRAKSKVQISVLCPGPVNTNFNARAGVSFSIPPAEPDEIVRYTIKMMKKKKLVILPTWNVKIGCFGARFVPLKLIGSICYHFQKSKLK